MAFIPPALAAITSAFSTTAATATAATVADVGATAAATAPGWLSTVGEIGVGLNALGGAVGTVGALKSAQAQASAAKYNSAVASVNAQQALKNAGLSSAEGSVQAMDQSLRTRAAVGETLANQAASGLDVNSGSAPQVRQSEAEIGETDALRIRSNATKEAYGYQIQAASQGAESALQKSEASADLISGYVNAGSTLLGSAGTAATNFAKYQLQGGFSA